MTRRFKLEPNHRFEFDPDTSTWKLKFYDSANNIWIDLMTVSDRPVETEFVVPAIFETPRNGLVADLTGIKYESPVIIPTIQMLRHCKGVAVEAEWTASNTDSTTDVELYDNTDSVVISKVSGNAGTDVKSTYNTIKAGNKLSIRVNVTTASTTSGATTDCKKAVVYFKVSLV